ncbi:hypothetical protein MiTe_01854 [Microcystis aeruginosa NIES-2520]|uniref:Uncharacterized protein n=1 Tax=Microcystis aeruginosa NIES-2520 TaxID=2303982 RepID=A0A5A5RJ48_MICAE|nr:hypothetical protein MiTe_01854 [Microcystis aeruginosa NIES-2520]
MIIPMDENEDFQHLEEMIANLQVKQKQILKGMLDYPIQIDSAIRILSDPSRQLVITHNNIRVRASQLGLTKGSQHSHHIVVIRGRPFTFLCHTTSVSRFLVKSVKCYSSQEGSHYEGCGRSESDIYLHYLPNLGLPL